MNLAEKISRYFLEFKVPRLRDRRGHYASTIMSDLRDQYWSLTGEPETDPTDIIGAIKMWIGNGLEQAVVTKVLQNLHFFGLHLIGTQIPAGGSNPNFDCYFDALVVEVDRTTGKWGKKYVIEVKTKSGYGADLLLRNMEVSQEYLAQMALYLKDAHEKGLTDEGIFLYVPLSDNCIGDMLFVYCRYDAEKQEVVGYKGQTLSGEERNLNLRFSVNIPIERAKKLDQALAEKKCPAGEYPYKYPITPELLASLSDKDIASAIKGEKVLGPWQPRYSRWKTKILKVDKVSPTYTDEEIAILRKEYLRRHPRSKI